MMPASTNKSLPKVAGIILAGGESRRFGYQDKSWMMLNNQPLIKRIFHKASPQVSSLCINTNCDTEQLDKFKTFNLPILSDKEYPKQGPLSGILTGLLWAKELNIEWLVSFPVDTPNIADDLVQNLIDKMIQTQYKRVIACDEQHEQNILGLWSIELIDTIRQGLNQQHNKINLCLQHEPYAQVLFKQSFMNINTPNLLIKANG